MVRRMAAVLLTVVLLAGVFTGCGKDKQTEVSDPMQPQQAEEKKFAYQASYEPLDLGADVQYVNQLIRSGNKLFLVADVITGTEIYVDPVTQEPILDEETGSPIEYETSTSKIFTMDPSTRTVTMLDYSLPEPEEGMEGSAYLNCFYPGSDGTLWFLETIYSYYFDLPEDFDPETGDPYAYYVDNGTSLCVVQVDGTGAVLQRVSLDVPADCYIGETVVVPDGTIYATDWNNIYRFDHSGSISGQLPMSNGVNRLLPVGESSLGVTVWENDRNSLKLLDPETMTLDAGNALPMNCYSMQTGVLDYDLVYENNTVFYGLRFDSQEPEKLFSWLDSDVDSGNIGQRYAFAEDGTVYAVEAVYDSENQRHDLQLITMKQVDASTLPQKQELVLACMYLDWDLRTDIINFNKASEDVRIVVQDYSQYATEEDYNAGLQKLNTEILSGVVPDLFYLDGTIPQDVYAAKGVFQDLWPLIDGDPELSREDLMTHFFDTLSVDGKLYQAVDTFTIETTVGLQRVVGDRTSWTVQELMEIYRQLPAGASIFGEMDIRENMLHTCILRSSSEFVDWEKQTCHFDSEEFIDLLEFVQAFPESFDYDNYDWSTSESDALRLRQGKQLMLQAYLSGFEQLQNYFFACGQEPCFVGYPTTTGSGSYFQTYGGLAISASCRNTDAAWSFVRQILTEDYQTTDYMWSFPTNRHAFETYAQRQMTPEYQKDADGQFVLDENGEKIELAKSWYYISEEEQGEIYAMTQQEYDLFLSIYENTAGAITASESINEIIQSEVEAYFAGQKTAKETAVMIQDRATLYVFEQG